MNQYEEHHNTSEDYKPPPMQLVVLYDRKRDRRPPVSSDYPGNKDRKLFQCIHYKDTPLTPPVHICASGHPTCGQCYTSDNREGSMGSYGMTQEGQISDSEPSTVHSSACSLGTYTSSSSLDIFKPPPQYIPPLQSYVPVKCPIQTCGGIVTRSTFISHFEFEHRSVPIIVADYNATNCKLAVNPSAFQDYNVQCLAIFLVPNENPVSPSVVKMVTAKESIMICLIMASKFTFIRPKHSGSKGDGAETFFLAWAAFLYGKPPIYYTIEAVNSNEKLNTIKYQGPIGTLHESQNPDKVFRRGNCLVVTPGLLRRLSNPSGKVDISVSFDPVSV